MIYSHGIHYMDTLVVPAGQTYEAVPGARVIITKTNGLPPNIENHGTLKNIWCGGTRETQQGANVYAFDNSIFDGVTLFGYYGGINGGSHINPKMLNSRFVNCGTDLLYHPIYINNFNAQENEGAIIYDNIFIGCEGYPIHLYHSPNYNDVQRNFVGGGLRCIAVEGHHNTIRDNIFWSNSEYACVWLGNDNGGSYLTFNHNLFGAATTSHYLNLPPNSIVKNNHFVGDAFQFGTSPKSIAKNKVQDYIGITHSEIMDIIENIKSTFNQNVNQLLVDNSIENLFGSLKAATLNWVP